MPFQPLNLQAQQVKDSQQVELLKGLQFENQQAQQTAQRASQFMQQMQQIPEGANWSDKLAGAASAAIKTGDFSDADKVIGVWGKVAEQQSKAAKEGADAVAKDLDNKQKKFGEVASALSGVTSQEDLNYRNQVYASAHGGEQLPFKQFVPGMDKTFQDMSTSALDRAKIISEQAKAKADQQRADAETMRAKAQAYADDERAKTESVRRDNLAKEGDKFTAEAEKARAAAASGGGTPGGGAINQRLAGRQYESLIAAETHVTNMSQLPAGTGIGTFGDLASRYNKSGSDALGSLTARKMTAPANRAFQQEAANLETELGILAASGSAGGASAHIVKDLQTMRPKDGDPPIVAANYLALAKQALQVANRGLQAWPGANDKQKQDANDVVKKIDAAVPWNVADVNKYITGDKKTASTQYSSMLGKVGDPGSSSDAPIPYDPGDKHEVGKFYKLEDGTIVKYKGQ